MTEKTRARSIWPLTSPLGVRKEMISVYRDLRLGKIESQDASRLAHILSTIMSAFRDCEVEAKIKELEELIHGPTKAEIVQPDPTLGKANAPELPCHVKDAKETS